MDRLRRSFFSTVLFFFAFLPGVVFAEDAITLSISPSLYEMSAEPGQEWRSTLKVVNVNKFDLTVYADVVNFAPRGEGGEGMFMPVGEEGEGVTLAEWFSITTEPIIIPREQSVEIPFSVRVPFDASPGGHFAAILIGTKPIANTDGSSKLQTAQMVTSLFFARVAGDVVESGTIREFTTEKSILGRPEATFSLRFENKGNVHLQPRGEIKIYNMWGEERGIVPINQQANFGNVLPESIRKFLFTWKGEWSVSDIGRYSAIATLGYGTEEVQFASAKTYFWVLPLKLLFGIFLGVSIFIVLLTWLVRLYVRHMLVVAGIGIEDYQSVRQRSERKKKVTFHAPVQAGILDLSQRLKATKSFVERMRSLLTFAINYRLFFLAVSLIVVFISMVVWYVKSANTAQRAFEVVYLQNEKTEVSTTNSEEIIYNSLPSVETQSAKSATSTATLAVVNRSGTPGLGATVRVILEESGYSVSTLTADFLDTQARTVITATAPSYDDALTLSRTLNGVPVSIVDDSATSVDITVYVGSDAESW